MEQENSKQYPDNNLNNAKVLYICSDVRSGSTLLDMLLGRLSSLKSVGELHHLYNYLNDNYYNYKTKEDLCTCKQKVSECSFWKTVIEGFLKENKNLKELKTRYDVKQNRLAEAFFKIAFAFLPVHFINYLSRYSSRIKSSVKVADNLSEIYRMINFVSDSEYVVDSSKSPETIKYLRIKHSDSLKVIYLKRDLRAIAFSKNRRRPERGTIYKSALNTLIFNFILNIYIFFTPKKQRLVIRHENLIKDSQKTIKGICKFLNIDFEEKVFDDSFQIQFHNLGGSPRRFTNKTFSHLRLDERWKKELTTKEIFILNLILKLSNKINGY
jgi:hypothetical protein